MGTMRPLVGPTGLAMMTAAALLAGCGSSSEPDSAAPSKDAGATSTASQGSAVNPNAKAAGNGKPFVIGMINQEEGTVAFPELSKGAKVAVDYANAELGGVDGHPIELRLCKVANDPESNQRCAQKLANDDDVDVVMLGSSTNSGPIHKVLGAAKKPIIGGSPLSMPDLTSADSSFWSGGLVKTIQALATFTTKDLEAKRVAVLYTEDPIGKQGLALSKPVFDAAGTETKLVPVATEAADLVGPLTAAGAAKADALVLLLTQPGCIQAANAIKQLSIDVPVVSVGSCTDASVTKAVGAEALDGWYFAMTSRGAEEPPSAPEDVVTYRRAFERYAPEGGGPVSQTASVLYGATLVLRELAEQVGFDRISSDRLRDAAREFRGPVPAGPREVSCPGNKPFVALCVDGAFIERYVDGRFEPAADGELIAVGAAASPAGSEG